jgi:hypothetical protein
VERSSRIFQRKLLCGDMDELETAIATGTCLAGGFRAATQYISLIPGAVGVSNSARREQKRPEGERNHQCHEPASWVYNRCRFRSKNEIAIHSTSCGARRNLCSCEESSRC